MLKTLFCAEQINTKWLGKNDFDFCKPMHNNYHIIFNVMLCVSGCCTMNVITVVTFAVEIDQEFISSTTLMHIVDSIA